LRKADGGEILVVEGTDDDQQHERDDEECSVGQRERQRELPLCRLESGAQERGP
jgi:hypothetical protein